MIKSHHRRPSLLVACRCMPTGAVIWRPFTGGPKRPVKRPPEGLVPATLAGCRDELGHLPAPPQTTELHRSGFPVCIIQQGAVRGAVGDSRAASGFLDTAPVYCHSMNFSIVYSIDIQYRYPCCTISLLYSMMFNIVWIVGGKSPVLIM